MANQKRKRQRAARAAREAAARKNQTPDTAAEPGALPDVPDAGDDATPTEADVVSEAPAKEAAPKRQSAAAEARRQAVRDVRLRKQRNKAFRRFAIIAAAVIATFVLIGFLLAGGDDDVPHIDQPDANYVTFLASDFGTGECATPGGEAPTTFADAPQQCIDQGEPLQAVLTTNLGTVTVQLNTNETLGTANNFVNLARSGYYDGLEVFRTDPNTGTVYSGATTNDQNDPGPGYTIPDEATGFVYGPGLLVMSRSNEPDSAGSTYFLTVNDDASALDAQGNFVVFGEVTDGLDVLEAILDLHEPEPGRVTGGRPSDTVTVQSVVIESLPEE